MARKKFKREKARLFALLSMVLGTVLMVVLVVSFNAKVKKKEVKVKELMRYVKMSKQAPKQKKKKPKPKAKKARPKAAMPDLSSLLGGIAMDIPEFSSGNIMGNAKNILGDIVADTAMSEGTVDSKPRVLSRSAMEYPSAALKKKIKGYVIINLLIAKDGTVELAKVIASNPAGVFDAVALRGIRSWRFTPAKYKGNPVKVWAKQKVRFDFN